jgi:hypothetical protein
MWNGRILKHTYPELHSFSIHENITFKKVVDIEALKDIFNCHYQRKATINYVD